MSSAIHPTAVIGLVPRRAGATRRPVGTVGNVEIGPGSIVGPYAVIYTDVRIGASCLIGDGASIREGCRIGAGSTVGRRATLLYDVTVGEGVTIHDGAHITGGCVIGDGAFIGPNVTTANDPRPMEPYDAARLAPPVIGARCLVGAGAVLLPGVVLEDGAQVGAGAVVRGRVRAGAVVLPVVGRVVEQEVSDGR